MLHKKLSQKEKRKETNPTTMDVLSSTSKLQPEMRNGGKNYF